MSTRGAITYRDELRCADTHAGRFLEGLLRPGIDVRPLFLGPYDGVRR